jgi:hypothetical protein
MNLTTPLTLLASCVSVNASLDLPRRWMDWDLNYQHHTLSPLESLAVISLYSRIHPCTMSQTGYTNAHRPVLHEDEVGVFLNLGIKLRSPESTPTILRLEGIGKSGTFSNKSILNGLYPFSRNLFHPGRLRGRYRQDGNKNKRLYSI